MSDKPMTFEDRMIYMWSVRNENSCAELSDGDAVALKAAHAREVAEAEARGFERGVAHSELAHHGIPILEKK